MGYLDHKVIIPNIVSSLIVSLITIALTSIVQEYIKVIGLLNILVAGLISIIFSYIIIIVYRVRSIRVKYVLSIIVAITSIFVTFQFKVKPRYCQSPKNTFILANIYDTQKSSINLRNRIYNILNDQPILKGLSFEKLNTFFVNEDAPDDKTLKIAHLDAQKAGIQRCSMFLGWGYILRWPGDQKVILNYFIEFTDKENSYTYKSIIDSLKYKDIDRIEMVREYSKEISDIVSFAIGISFFENKNYRKAVEHLSYYLSVTSNSDTTYKIAHNLIELSIYFHNKNQFTSESIMKGDELTISVDSESFIELKKEHKASNPKIIEEMESPDQGDPIEIEIKPRIPIKQPNGPLAEPMHSLISDEELFEIINQAFSRNDYNEAKQLLRILNARDNQSEKVKIKKRRLSVLHVQQYFHDFIFRSLYPFSKKYIMSKRNPELVDSFINAHHYLEEFRPSNTVDSVLFLMAINEISIIDYGLRRRVGFYNNILHLEAFENKFRTIEDEKLRLTYLFWTNYYFGLNYANITFAGIGNQANNIRNAKSYIQDALDIFYEMKKRGIEPDHDLHHINVDGLQVSNMHLLLSLVHKAQIDRKRNADKDGTLKAEMLKEFKLAQEYKSPYAKYYEPYMLDLGN